MPEVSESDGLRWNQPWARLERPLPFCWTEDVEVERASSGKRAEVVGGDCGSSVLVGVSFRLPEPHPPRDK